MSIRISSSMLRTNHKYIPTAHGFSSKKFDELYKKAKSKEE